MELTSDEVENYLNIIFTGQKFVYLDDKLFLFKQPGGSLRLRADLLYKKAYSRAVADGMLPIKDLEQLILDRNLFTENDQKMLDGLKSRLEAQEVLLSKTTKVKARQDRIKEAIVDLRTQMNELLYKKTSKLSFSAESKAEEERSFYLCWACSFFEVDNNFILHWPTFKDFYDERDFEFRNEILLEFLRFKSGVNTEIVRHLARHSLWRIRYITSVKVSEQLFGVPASQYTNDMLNLAYWSNFYQNIYEMMPRDRPSDSVIEDDDALDAYMKEYYAERSREDASERSKHTSRGKLSAFDKEEVIVTSSNELYEDIQYDKPREAQRIKDRVDLTKRTRRAS